MSDPLCFVVTPFGTKECPNGRPIQFDDVYQRLLSPAIVAAGMRPLRADEENCGGIIHKPMFERLILCDFAIADVSIPNANVYYELGIRHATRPCTTVAVFRDGMTLPFDVSLMRAVPYSTSADGRLQFNEAGFNSLVRILTDSKQKQLDDSPVFQLLDWFRAGDIEHAKCDGWAERMEYAETAKDRLRTAREEGLEAIQAAEAELGDLSTVEAGVLIDLVLSYRYVDEGDSWAEMIRAIKRLPDQVRRSPLVQEQLALALNRVGDDTGAEKLLLRIIEQRGPSSETNSLLGRVYKDRYRRALGDKRPLIAQGALSKAIDTYLQGFETDWRDAYPGINAVMLMEQLKEPDPRQQEILPVVRYSVERRLATQKSNYWDYATLLELAVLEADFTRAAEALSKALACGVENAPFARRTTAQTLQDIHKARTARGENHPWVLELIEELTAPKAA